MDIKPPKNWKRPLPPLAPPTSEMPLPQPITTQPIAAPETPRTTIHAAVIDDNQPIQKPKKKRTRLFIILGILLFIVLAVGSTVGWYFYELQPRDAKASMQTVVIEQGMTPRSIAALLEQKAIIRNKIAFEVYASLSGHADSLQAGSYRIGASLSVPAIVEHLLKGQNDTYNVIILPGMTLKQLADPDVKNSLAAQGFSNDEITAAFSASYTSPVLADRPSGASLEGYIYPETYQMRAGDSLESLVQRSIDELYDQLQTNNLIQKFADRGLTIHQGLTLASIVQKEVNKAADEPQVAQVFLKRLAIGMMLGSDVTALYGARLDGVSLPSDAAAAAAIAIAHDSPYNTRKYAGLPPGPIASMNLSALEAVGNPAAGEYLYFVAGDDGTTYFSTTYEEHEAAVSAHCGTLCGN